MTADTRRCAVLSRAGTLRNSIPGETKLTIPGTKKDNALAYVFSRPVLRRNLTIALIVGCVLSVANQYDLLLRAPLTASLLVKLFFNFLVPFIVSSSSAAVNRPPNS